MFHSRLIENFLGHRQIIICQNLYFLFHSRLIEIFLGHQIIICQNLYFLLHSRLIEKFWDIIKSCSLFAGTFCFIADYTIDFFGYDLCIIAIIFPLEPEKFFLTSLIHVIYIFNIDFFWRLWSIHNSYNIPLGAWEKLGLHGFM